MRACQLTRSGRPALRIASSQTIAPPLDARLWQAAGVRSRRAFMSGTALVHAARDADALTVTPTRNDGSAGPTRGWTASPCAPPLPAAADDGVGAAVRAALADASSAPDLGRDLPLRCT